MNGFLQLVEEIKCMEAVGVQDGTGLMAALEKSVFACLAGPQKENSVSVETTGSNETEPPHCTS